jgi:hypothetical protein
MAAGLRRGDRCELLATAIAWLTDEPQPGLVLVELADAHDRPHQLVGKSAYFGGDLLPNSIYPGPTSIPCTIDGIDNDTATVSTRWLSACPDATHFVFEVRLNARIPDPDVTTQGSRWPLLELTARSTFVGTGY